jgi:hypothetical protein
VQGQLWVDRPTGQAVSAYMSQSCEILHILPEIYQLELAALRHLSAVTDHSHRNRQPQVRFLLEDPGWLSIFQYTRLVSHQAI